MLISFYSQAKEYFMSKPAHPLKAGVQFHPQHCTYQEFADVVRRAEEMGADSIWNWDHFYPLYGDPQGNHFEGWTLLTAMAMLTSKAEVGCLVTCNSYRNPALLANMAKTLDHISNGRLILGIGAGWFERDYNEYGYEFGTPGTRLAALREALPIIRERWEKEVPKPLRQIPILIGGGGEKVTLRITAQYANMWHGFGGPDTIKQKLAVLRDWCATVDRDPEEITISVSPSVEQLSDDLLDSYVEVGVTHFILGSGHDTEGKHPNDPWQLEKLQQLIAWRNSRQQA
jgi:probable F420-dependent oxidoreductase